LMEFLYSDSLGVIEDRFVEKELVGDGLALCRPWRDSSCAYPS
jgi:hypothetical protein